MSKICGYEYDFNHEFFGCDTCLHNMKLEQSQMTQPNQSELDMNMIEKIIADHNKAMRTDMASEIVGGTRSKAITDVITVKAIAAYITANYTPNSEVERHKQLKVQQEEV